MPKTYEKLSQILGAKTELFEQLDNRMSALSGKPAVFRHVLEEGEATIIATLERFGLSAEQRTAENVYTTLATRLTELDAVLYQYLDRPSLLNPASCEKMLSTALELAQPPKGFFIKEEKAIAMLEIDPPQQLLAHMGYANIRELVEKEGLVSVMGALRFVQDSAWMHNFFDRAYSDLIASDFEERPVQIKILDTKWLGETTKFVEHKFHNLSHLKEWGIIFVVPLEIDTPGEMLRVFSLLLHYLNEVPFYSALFRRFANRPDFAGWVKSLLRGDVLTIEQITEKKLDYDWLIIQRYLAKDDTNDPRLFLPHVNPETIHWHKVGENFTRLKPLIGATGEYFDIWHNLDWVAGWFSSATVATPQLVSFNIIDLVMSLVDGDGKRYLYHQFEALWNKLFIAHLGREKLDQLISEHIIDGYIKFWNKINFQFSITNFQNYEVIIRLSSAGQNWTLGDWAF